MYLDITHRDPAWVREHFPNIHEKCLSVGIDITKDWIPIVPAAHYSCGGVLTDTNGRTSIENLYACGEVACTGVHGANRLASNSLLEAVVFARRAAFDAGKEFASASHSTVSEFDLERHSRSVSPGLADELILTLRSTMWKYVGIIRTNERLAKALEQIRKIRAQAEAIYSTGRLSPALLELRNLALAAELITISAQSRKESRGLHFNTDYPELDDLNFKHDTLLAASEDAAAELVKSDAGHRR